MTEEKKTTGKVVRRSWKPANLIEIPKKYQDPNFVYRCVDKNRPGRVLQKINEGWEIDKYIVPKMRKEGYFDGLVGTMDDGIPKDDTLQFRELIVMRLHKDIKADRDAYLKSIDPAQQLKETDDQFHKETGGRTYGEVKISKGG